MATRDENNWAKILGYSEGQVISFHIQQKNGGYVNLTGRIKEVNFFDQSRLYLKEILVTIISPICFRGLPYFVKEKDILC